MKTYRQFFEDVNQLQRDLSALERQERLSSRAQSAKERSRNQADRFKRKSLERSNEIKAKHAEMQHDYNERIRSKYG